MRAKGGGGACSRGSLTGHGGRWSGRRRRPGSWTSTTCLLGLVREGDGVAAQVLTGLGADLDGAREQVIRLLEEYRRKHGHQTG
jgi:hypothetical protein